MAEQEELERQMKELQAANENKQQELEAVRKVGTAPGRGRALHCRSHSGLASDLRFHQDRLTATFGRFFSVVRKCIHHVRHPGFPSPESMRVSGQQGHVIDQKSIFIRMSIVEFCQRKGEILFP